MNDFIANEISESLKSITEFLADISDSLATLAENALAESQPKEFGFLASMMEDGALNVPRSEVRTFGDTTILSGDEEGLK